MGPRWVVNNFQVSRTAVENEYPLKNNVPVWLWVYIQAKSVQEHSENELKASLIDVILLRGSIETVWAEPKLDPKGWRDEGRWAQECFITLEEAITEGFIAAKREEIGDQKGLNEILL